MNAEDGEKANEVDVENGSQSRREQKGTYREQECRTFVRDLKQDDWEPIVGRRFGGNSKADERLMKMCNQGKA